MGQSRQSRAERPRSTPPTKTWPFFIALLLLFSEARVVRRGRGGPRRGRGGARRGRGGAAQVHSRGRAAGALQQMEYSHDQSVGETSMAPHSDGKKMGGEYGVPAQWGILPLSDVSLRVSTCTALAVPNASLHSVWGAAVWASWLRGPPGCSQPRVPHQRQMNYYVRSCMTQFD